MSPFGPARFGRQGRLRGMATSHKLTWELHTQADITAAWASLSDTDRFNRLAELNFTFEPAPAGSSVRRIGRMKRLGMVLTWDELPFTYEAPRWFKTRRIFHGGPAKEFSATLQLKESRWRHRRALRGGGDAQERTDLAGGEDRPGALHAATAGPGVEDAHRGSRCCTCPPRCATA